MSDAGRHPNIRILSNSEVVEVEGEPGAFTVTIVRHPRYVEEELCTGCGTCSTYCPISIPNPYDENLGPTKAISVWCPQAVPKKAYVDRNACQYFVGKCTLCIAVCKNKAINFAQKRKRGKVQVGAILVATGYGLFDVSHGPWGYGEFKNVVTSMEYERITNASGPTAGEILRRSDGVVPDRIAWIQCVGSRSFDFGRSYCSAFCCTYAIKQAMVTKDHHPDIDTVIFHMDVRTFGKGFEDLYNRAKKRGIKFVRSRIPVLREDPETKDIVISYYDGERLVRERFGMVVLSVGAVPAADNLKLSRLLGLELNEHGFFKAPSLYPLDGDRKGVYVGGCAVAPMDVPDTICSAGAAASEVAELLAPSRGTLSVKKEYPPERSVEGEEPKIGVFICHCGSNIAGVIEVKDLVDYAWTLEGVVYAEDQLISCSNEGLSRIVDQIKEKGLNRVVVAACTPRTHEPVFREALREAGLNPYLLELVNIREHCSWVHSMEKEVATEKARELLRMAVARARRLAPLSEPLLKVDKRALVIGGGVAGMTAALSLARQGFDVYLVEKEGELGGNFRKLRYTLEGRDPQVVLERLVSEIMTNPKVKAFVGYEVSELHGFVGNFKTVIASRQGERVELEHGVIVVATGGELLRPSSYLYGKHEGVVTQFELEQMLSEGKIPKGVKRVVMIQCVESREPGRSYCSRICCAEAVKNALKLKELDPEMEVVVLYRDMRTYGFVEDYYHKARQKGVLFLRYEAERKPSVEPDGEGLRVRCFVPTIAEELELKADLLVLSTPVIPGGTAEIAERLNLQTTPDGFLAEVHPKLRPVDSPSDGVFICGMAHYPKFSEEAISQAKTAALRAAILMSQEEIRASGAVCQVQEDLCMGCGACVEVCAYGALGLEEKKKGLKKAQVNPVLCKGDGLCVTKCPTGAVTLQHFTDQQIIEAIDALTETKD